VRGDSLVDRGANGLRGLSEKAARRGGLAAKLAQPLAEDSIFLRKLKPSLVRARAKGAAPQNGTPNGAASPLPEPAKKTGGGPSPLAVIGGAAAAGFFAAKLVDWRGDAHPRD
jgi:hypothetical protein